MEAMILAAGAGTRLRPITDRTPKALVEVRGRPLLARVLDRLIEIGVSRVIVNTHHHEEQIRTFIAEHRPADTEIVLSSEPDGPYDTGGGLFAAAQLFEENQPFLLHNADELTTIPLDGLLAAHNAEVERLDTPPIASLAVMSRESSSWLLFDDLGLLGWEREKANTPETRTQKVRDPIGTLRRMAFPGIHVVDPKIFSLSNRTGTFSILTLYLELAALGYKILPIDVSEYNWIDVGTVERLQEAECVEW